MTTQRRYSHLARRTIPLIVMAPTQLCLGLDNPRPVRFVATHSETPEPTPLRVAVRRAA